MDYRQKNKVSRNDFMQLLLQLKTLGYVKDADNPEKDNEQIGKLNKCVHYFEEEIKTSIKIIYALLLSMLIRCIIINLKAENYKYIFLKFSDIVTPSKTIFKSPSNIMKELFLFFR